MKTVLAAVIFNKQQRHKDVALTVTSNCQSTTAPSEWVNKEDAAGPSSGCRHLLCCLDGVIHLQGPQALVHLVHPLFATPTSATPIDIQHHDVPAADQVRLPLDGILLRHLLRTWSAIPENDAGDSYCSAQIVWVFPSVAYCSIICCVPGLR